MRKFSILGITLTDLTAREALKRADRYLRNGALNTLTYLTAQVLAEAAKDEQIAALVEETDMTLCVEPDILEAAGIANASRTYEISERIFLKELLRRLAKQQMTVFVLGDTLRQAQALRGMLLEQQENLNIADCRGYDEFEGQKERLMNALNETAPGVIFSRMTWPVDLELMHEGRRLLNAEFWVALPEKEMPGKGHMTVFRKIRKRLFQKKVDQYREDRADQ